MKLSRAIAIVLITCFGLVGCSKEQSRNSSVGYCSPSSETTLILIDITTTLDDRDTNNLIEGIEETVLMLGIGNRLEIATLTDDFGTSRQIFDHCLPGCPPGGMLDWITSSCSSIRARSEKLKFDRDLVDSLKSILIDQQDFSNSEVLRSIAYRTQEPENSVDYLFIFSDMLENSRELPYSTFLRRSNESLMSDVRDNGLVPHLTGAEVSVFGFGRAHNASRLSLSSKERQKLRRFWETYFKAGGAASVSISEELH